MLYTFKAKGFKPVWSPWGFQGTRLYQYPFRPCRQGHWQYYRKIPGLCGRRYFRGRKRLAEDSFRRYHRLCKVGVGSPREGSGAAGSCPCPGYGNGQYGCLKRPGKSQYGIQCLDQGYKRSKIFRGKSAGRMGTAGLRLRRWSGGGSGSLCFHKR